MGELIVILFAIATWLICSCICFAGYTNQNKRNHLRLVLGFAPVLNIIIALFYISLFFKMFSTDTIGGILENKDQK